MKKYWLVLSILAVVVAFAVYKYSADDHAIVSQYQPPPSANTPAPQASARNPVNAGIPYKDTSMLKPPAGAKVAIYEFEDLECPGCAYAAPLVHAAAAQYKIPLVRHDYPWSFHVWSFDAAVTARYIQDKISPQLADDFRRDVFAGQTLIATKDDLARFTAKWFQSHGQSLPFVMDASGACKLEVESDRALGDRLGIHSTPCLFVVTQTTWIPVADVDQIGQIIDAALAQTADASDMPSKPGFSSPLLRLKPPNS